VTARHYITIWCDGEGCLAFIETGEHTAPRARECAHADGWFTVKPSRDLCPLCYQAQRRAGRQGGDAR
jgi:hypothetical protein